MKNRVIYAVLLASLISQRAFAQEVEEAQAAVESLGQDVAQLEQEVSALEEAQAGAQVAEAVAEEAVAQEEESESAALKAKAEVNIGLNEQKRKEVVDALNVLVSDEYLLYTKTFKYHWNVQGKHFASMHEFFQKQYEALQGFSDEVAERIRMFGFMAPGTFAEFSKFATLSEQVNRNPEDLEMVSDLLQDHEQIIRNLRGYVDLTAKVNDMGTNNFLADLLTKHEKMAWMLRAFLER